MFRTGIWTVEQFLRSANESRRRPKTVSIRLLDVPDNAGAEDIRVFEAISCILRTSNGTYRTTYPNRFSDLDAVAAVQIRRFFAADTAFEVQDRAASNCLTSAEWAETLLPFFKNILLTASDLLIFLIEAKLPSGETFILEPTGEPLQYIRPPFVLKLAGAESRWDIANRLLRSQSQRKIRGLRIPPEWLSGSDRSELSVPPWSLRRISFTHPRARSLARSDPRFQIAAASVFDSTPDVCQVLRTVNILNRSYFAEEKIREGIRAALLSLTENGIWIVGRTVGESNMTNHATIFRKRNNTFEVLDRVGEGWEFESWAL